MRIASQEENSKKKSPLVESLEYIMQNDYEKKPVENAS